MEEIHKF